MCSIVIISCLSKPFFCSKIREHNSKLNTGLALGFFFKEKSQFPTSLLDSFTILHYGFSFYARNLIIMQDNDMDRYLK